MFLIRQKVLNTFNSVYEEISKRTVGIEKERKKRKRKFGYKNKRKEKENLRKLQIKTRKYRKYNEQLLIIGNLLYYLSFV